MPTSASAKTNLILDITVFVGFLLLANPRSTGNTIHEWLGIAFAAAIITHLIFHWKWLLGVLAKFFNKLFHESRLNLLIDLLFFISMTGVIFSGILISRDVIGLFGLKLEVSRAWRSIHELTTHLSVITLGIHTALHWNWIVNTYNKYIAEPLKNRGSKKEAPNA